ncbi:MAG: amidase [Betaproteobacteria bacterium]|jgi:aspartyl-tRNA(Asn)/glutamyl-tRNA(Gln) amidotransferase subunit A|nr:amidase [Betaproteobacteria bacterium]
MTTVAALAAELAAGRSTSRALVEQSLERIADQAGEGARAFLKTYADLARAEADHADRLRRSGLVRSSVDGLPISVKDLFDVGGDVTRAGSKILADAPPAARDAPVVARLRAAGAVIVGRTNMVEFAFGGVGLNAHYGTPRNPWDRATGRVPGGSSSGAGVAVADGMCVMGLGSDTRGSVRIPAALNGIAGFKPTARRVPREGAFPLSFLLDSVGPLAQSIACCAAYDAVIANEPAVPLAALPVKGLRLMLPRSSALEDLDAQVGKTFELALSQLGSAGAIITEVAMPAFDRQDQYFKGGGFAGAEAAAIHRKWSHRIDEYDPRVGKRIVLGDRISGPDLVEIGLLREAYIREVDAAATPFDAILIPTVSCVAPTIDEVSATDDAYFRWNARLLRNCGLINFLDGCAATVPCHVPGTAPVGMMVCGTTLRDRHILAVANAIEGAFARNR